MANGFSLGYLALKSERIWQLENVMEEAAQFMISGRSKGRRVL